VAPKRDAGSSDGKGRDLRALVLLASCRCLRRVRKADIRRLLSTSHRAKLSAGSHDAGSHERNDGGHRPHIIFVTACATMAHRSDAASSDIQNRTVFQRLCAGIIFETPAHDVVVNVREVSEFARHDHWQVTVAARPITAL